MSGSAGVSYAFCFAAIVLVAIDILGDHHDWLGYVAIACIVLAMLTRPSGFFGTRSSP